MPERKITALDEDGNIIYEDLNIYETWIRYDSKNNQIEEKRFLRTRKVPVQKTIQDGIPGNGIFHFGLSRNSNNK